MQLSAVLELPESVEKMTVIMHPGYQDDDVAMMAVDPNFDFEQEFVCFYCGDEEIIPVCNQCGLSLCNHCTTSVGCTCMLAENTEVVVDGFVPKPGQDRTTTMPKSMRKKVMRGYETVSKQDKATWATLTGKPILSSIKKCLLAITLFAGGFNQAIGHTTNFVDPGELGNKCDASFISDLNKTIEEQDPSLLYIHVPFVDDYEDSGGYHNLKEFAKEHMDSGRTCIIADSRHADGWEGLEPSLCLLQ